MQIEASWGYCLSKDKLGLGGLLVHSESSLGWDPWMNYGAGKHNIKTLQESEDNFPQPLFHSFFIRVNKTGLKWHLSVVRSARDGWPQGMLLSKGCKEGGRWEANASWLTFKSACLSRILHTLGILVEWFKKKKKSGLLIKLAFFGHMS